MILDQFAEPWTVDQFDAAIITCLGPAAAREPRRRDDDPASGALLVLGDVGANYFAELGVPVEAAARDAYELWLPADCPLCANGLPLEDVSSPPTP